MQASVFFYEARFRWFFCLEPACHVWKHTVFLVVSHSYPPQTSHSKPSCGLHLTGFNHAWLSHTLNHAVASLIVCHYPSRIPIRETLPSSSSSPLHQRCFSPCVGCAGASVCRNSARKKREWGGGAGGWHSQVCLLSPRCKLTRKKTLSGSVGCFSGFLSAPTLPLSSEQWPEEFNKGGEARGVTVEWVACSFLSCWATWAPRASDSPSFTHQLINLQC